MISAAWSQAHRTRVAASPTQLDETADGVRKLGRKCKTVHADIRDIASLRAVAADTEKEFGKVDILVANAAIQRWKPLLEMEDADWRDVIDNNLNGTANTVRAFAPGMVERQYGRIILLSSMQGKQGTSGASSYSASKWGILGLMKSASMELGKHKITVNALIPGLVDTALTRYQARYHASMAMTENDPPEGPNAAAGVGRQVADGAATSGLDEASRRRTGPLSSWLPMGQPWSAAPSTRWTLATALTTSDQDAGDTGREGAMRALRRQRLGLRGARRARMADRR